MKKIVVLLLAISMVFSLCGCGEKKSDEVKKVEQLISSIGAVSLDREKYITDAESAYEHLYEADKEQVDNYDILVEARSSYNSLVQSVENEIKAEIAEDIVLLDDEKTVREGVSRLEQLKSKAVNDSQLELIQAALNLFYNACYYEGTTFKRFDTIASQLIDGLEINKTDYTNGVYYYSFNKSGITVDDAYRTYLRERYSGKTISDKNGYVTAVTYTDSEGNTLSILAHSFSGSADNYIQIKIN